MKRTLNRYLLGVQYQGDKYNGSSHITDHLRLALQQFNGADNMDNLTLSSRTDSKVHAIRNVWHVDLHLKNEVLNNVLGKKSGSAGGEVVLRALNHHLRKEDILISDCVQVPLTFECRRQAKYRTYMYRLIATPSSNFRRNLFQNRYAWNVPLLDVEAMQEASKHFIGIHDFSTFRNAGCQSRSPFRHLWSVEVCVENPKASIVGLGTSDDTYSDPFMMVRATY